MSLCFEFKHVQVVIVSLGLLKSPRQFHTRAWLACLLIIVVLTHVALLRRDCVPLLFIVNLTRGSTVLGCWFARSQWCCHHAIGDEACPQAMLQAPVSSAGIDTSGGIDARGLEGGRGSHTSSATGEHVGGSHLSKSLLAPIRASAERGAHRLESGRCRLDVLCSSSIDSGSSSGSSINNSSSSSSSNISSSSSSSSIAV